MSNPVLRSVDRADLRDLATGRRARHGLVTVRWVPPPPARSGQPARVAYAIGSRTGGAVVRNRIRRRLRAALADVSPPAGSYLVSAASEAATAPWSQLRDDLAMAVATVTEDRR